MLRATVGLRIHSKKARLTDADHAQPNDEDRLAGLRRRDVRHRELARRTECVSRGKDQQRRPS